MYFTLNQKFLAGIKFSVLASGSNFAKICMGKFWYKNVNW